MYTDIRLGLGTFEKLNFHGTVYYTRDVGVIRTLFPSILQHKNNLI